MCNRCGQQDIQLWINPHDIMPEPEEPALIRVLKRFVIPSVPAPAEKGVIKGTLDIAKMEAA